MADSRLPDPKVIRSGYVKTKNEAYGGLRGLRKWRRLEDAEGPKKYDRDEQKKDPGVV